MIRAPFNFVPLNEEVFFPEWAEHVSHDIPFEDGESGVIDITLTANSPIFIRDHHHEKAFCQYNGEYYIPGSSVKGMIRSVLEIMSFSKMGKELFTDSTYAVRDLRNRDLYMSKMTPERTMCGWLKKQGNTYIIEDCGVPGRIRHEEIDKIFNIDFASKFKSGNFQNKAQDKTAEMKYRLINSDNFTHNFTFMKKDVNRDVYQYNKDGDKRATLVFTGQPSARKEPTGGKASGKIYEFLFFTSQSERVVEKRVVENFLFAYFDGRKTEPKESSDWTFWKHKLEKGEKVPVFFQKNGKDIAHFGLSYLYKLPYAHSVKDGIPEIHFSASKDLAQTIFGYVDSDTKDALKGRVQFSHFKAIQNIKVLDERTEILGTPRASYYPMYVKQKDGSLFSTFMDGEFSLAGRKRYPVHSGIKTSATEETGNSNVGTTFVPLKDGVVFSGKMRYHNLKKVELGALLSALTFHDSKGCFHNIGLAKSLGYGKVTLKITGVSDFEEYLKEFELQINQQIEDWSNTEQIKELFTMATEQQNRGNSKLEYMKLTEFGDNKKAGNQDYLRYYSALDNIQSIQAESLISSEDLEALKVMQETMRKEKELRVEEAKKEKVYQEDLAEARKTENIQILQNFITNYPDRDEISEIITKKEKIEAEAIGNRHKEVDAKAKSAYAAVESKKGTKQYHKELQKFVKKWEASKNNKGSLYVEELVLKAKKALK